MGHNVLKVPYPDETVQVLAFLTEPKTVRQIKQRFQIDNIDAVLDTCCTHGLVKRSLKRTGNIDYIQFESAHRNITLKQGRRNFINKKSQVR